MDKRRLAPVKVARSKEMRISMAPEESVLWSRLRTNQLNGYHFYRQKVLDGFIVDFYCRQAKLVIEVDGAIHEQRIEYDMERDSLLSARGLHVLRFTNDEVRNHLPFVLERIAAACPSHP